MLFESYDRRINQINKCLNDNGIKDLLKNIDVLVDGKFQLANRKAGLRFRGSSNQRIIDIKESLKLGSIVILEY